MEVRNIILAGLAVGLVGCASTPTPPPRVVTDTVTVTLPVLYCPAPPEFTRPTLALSPTEIAEMSDGELAQAYHATIIALQGYASELELALQGYNEISEETKQLQQQLEELIKESAERRQP